MVASSTTASLYWRRAASLSGTRTSYWYASLRQASIPAGSIRPKAAAPHRTMPHW